MTTTKTISTQQQNEAVLNVAAHYIGEHYGGGIIFYLDSLGEHELIADETDLGDFTWRPQNILTITGANKTGIYQGKSNTRKIVQSQGSTIVNGNYAALACANLKKNGYTDWYLPAKAELNKLFRQRKLIGNFTRTYYWSSSEAVGNPADYAAWGQYFSDGSQSTFYKYNVLGVRTIRSF